MGEICGGNATHGSGFDINRGNCCNSLSDYICRMQKGKTTIFRQLILNIIVPVVFAVVLFSVVSYYLNHKNLRENYSSQQKQIERQAIDLLGLYDLGLAAHEGAYSERMEKISNELVQEHFKNTNGIDTLDLFRISKLAGIDTAKEFIYIIDENAVIINTTFLTDLHLDFSKRDTVYAIYLNNIRAKKVYVGDRFTNEVATGKIKKYSFQGTEDGKYAVELGFSSAAANEMWSTVKMKVNHLSTTYPEIERIDLLTAIPNAKNQDVYPGLDSVYKSMVYDKQPRHVELLLEDKMQYVDFFFVKMKQSDMFEGYVIQIISNDSRERALVNSEIKKSLIIFFATLAPLLLLVYFRAKKLTAPIILLTSKVKKIAGGNLHERVEVTGENEISELSSTFNKMVNELQESYEGLEQKVKDRTAEIESQKHIIEEKNKEVLDSITYAKRLQEAILPSVVDIRAALPDAFILYLPKDIVAGDFYWFEKLVDETGNSFLLFAAADSTGHGVPGAMVSVVCSNALHRTVNEFKIYEPGKILTKTRELVLETFAKSQSDVKDGMDISLISLEFGVVSSETSTPHSALRTPNLNFAGANNSAWIIRNGELVELKADRQPVGKTEFPKPFTNHIFQLEKGDLIYMLTDGFPDQFGGPKGKKFMSANLKKLLLSIRDLKMSEQEKIIHEAFETWKGELEQVDDVCVVGIRIG